MDEHTQFYESIEAFLKTSVATDFDIEPAEEGDDISLISETIVLVEHVDMDHLTCVVMIAKDCLNDDFIPSERKYEFGIPKQPSNEVWLSVTYDFAHDIWAANPPDSDELGEFTLPEITHMLDELVKRYNEHI